MLRAIDYDQSILHMKGLGNALTVQVSGRGSNSDATMNVLPDSGADITAAVVSILAISWKMLAIYCPQHTKLLIS